MIFFFKSIWFFADQRAPAPGVFDIPHSVTVAEEFNLVCVADRENGRIQCFDLEGNFKHIIKHPEFGTRLFAVEYCPLHGEWRACSVYLCWYIQCFALEGQLGAHWGWPLSAGQADIDMYSYSYSFLKIMKIIFWTSLKYEYLLEVLDFVIREKNTTNMAFPIFTKSSWSCLYWNFVKPLFDVLHMCERQKYADLLLEVLVCLQKTRSRRSFSEVSWKEHHICEGASRIDLQNQDAICKNILCVRESMVESIDCAPAIPSPVKMRCFQNLRKVTMRSGVLSL